jgi:hypothetical protein
MSDATKYTIKPLVWEEDANGEYHTNGGWIFAYVFPISSDGLWAMELKISGEYVTDHAGDLMVFRSVGFPSVNSAKLTVEAAYRRLLAEHLEAVE